MTARCCAGVFETRIEQWSRWARSALPDAQHAAVTAELDRWAASAEDGVRLSSDTGADGCDSLQGQPAAAADGATGDAAEEARAQTSQVDAGTVLGPAGEADGLDAAEEAEEEDAEQVGAVCAAIFRSSRFLGLGSKG